MNPILIAGLAGCLIGGAISAYCFSVISHRKIDMYKRALILLKLLKNNLKHLDGNDYQPDKLIGNTDVDNAVFALIPYLPVGLRKPFNDLWVTYRFDKFSKTNRPPGEYTTLAPGDSKKLITDRTHELIKFLNEIIYSV
ncbi:hypothetical protein [Geobacter sp. AOG2]|uniref:hypothetical protein n=1 Tax=Geobacter sp. AOG2 TaxID=1566347 RepID=UPI001CC667DB|nr:hypothetical protein [Geobacter sp. AOG2]